MARARWPGWTKQRTLLLPVPPADWAPPGSPVTVDGVILQPKRELHVTLVGTALGRALHQAMDAGRMPAGAVRDAFEACDWRWERPGRWSLLRAPAGGGHRQVRHAVIEHLDLPAMARFHAALGERLGAPHPVPPPHVTLYVAGTRRGIGLPDAATLARLRVRDLSAGEPGTFTPDTRRGADAGLPS